MRGWRTPRRTSAPWSPMKSNDKGPQMSRMGQGALGPKGRRAADVQSDPPPPPPPQKEAAYGVQIDVGLPCFRNEGLEGIRTWGPAAPEGRTILVPPVHLFGWEGSHCNPNGRASMDKNMEDLTAIQKGRAPTAPKRKAHTAIRSGELPRGLKERAPYMNQGRSHSAIKTGEPTLRLERESLDGIWMGEPTRRFEWESPLQEW